MGRRYRRKNSAASIVSDTVYIGSRLPWWGALLLGGITFLTFYFLLPHWLGAKLSSQSGSRMYPFLEVIFGRRIHWLEWIGIACGLIGLFFGVRNYYWSSQAGYRERGIIAFLAKIFGRDLD
ncbi:hypothetical protein [Marinobacterium sedimentorum]|uniref:hypothetical protein n=1 Tax=Marinobacterium sedimentorum TaxID=2927804 RepID=UPI0020C6F5DE|nr:hypothetical protein [Marinobacterium sedimentorum]MCP8687735.1 hypothetical protein [Marinobacterium sedimentorum]